MKKQKLVKRNKWLNYVAILLMVIVTGGCDGHFLDLKPKAKLSDETVWQSPTLIKRFIAGIYSNIISIYDSPTGLMMYYTDLGEANRSYLWAQKVNKAQYNAASNIYEGIWTRGYQAIRQCNIALEKLPDAPIDDVLKKRLMGEARFLRAYFYLQIYLHFGRFPIVKKSLSLNDKLTIPRASKEKCINFMVNDLNRAAKLLPVSYSTKNIGRATKGAAYAYKAWLLLNVKNYEGARDAAEDVMDLHKYSIFPDFSTLFLPKNDNNQAIIFDKQYAGDQSGQTQLFTTYMVPRVFSGFAGAIANPSQNLVDIFEMKDGLSWKKSPLYDPHHPYRNRDPRFYSTIMYDGSKFRGETINMIKGSVYNPNTAGSVTGYYIRKFLNPDYSYAANISNYENADLMRYAQVILMYAEAQYKLGAKGIARTYINKLRAKRGMPSIKAGNFTFDDIIYGWTAEMAFEGKRFYNIRRWGLGPELLGGKLYGIVVKEQNGIRTYTRTVVENRVFKKKMYWWPIPLSVLQKYPKGKRLEQNPGW